MTPARVVWRPLVVLLSLGVLLTLAAACGDDGEAGSGARAGQSVATQPPSIVGTWTVTDQSRLLFGSEVGRISTARFLSDGTALFTVPSRGPLSAKYAVIDPKSIRIEYSTSPVAVFDMTLTGDRLTLQRTETREPERLVAERANP